MRDGLVPQRFKMQISGAAQYGMLGIQRGMTGMERNAADIASADRLNGTATTDVSQPLVEQRENLRQVEASAKVVQAGDAMVGSLIDIMA